MTDTVQGPREPTDEMIFAGTKHIFQPGESWEKCVHDVYVAMIAAAPQATDPRDAALCWTKGEPPKYIAEHWFIAETTYGDRLVLRALPEEYTYDYKTADGTYIKADKIKRWMQFPDSEFKSPAETAIATLTAERDAALDRALECEVSIAGHEAMSAKWSAEAFEAMTARAEAAEAGLRSWEITAKRINEEADKERNAAQAENRQLRAELAQCRKSAEVTERLHDGLMDENEKLREVLQGAVDLLDTVEIFVKSRQQISRPYGHDLFNERLAGLRTALSPPPLSPEKE